MELFLNWVLWTLVYFFVLTELNTFLDYDWRRKGKPRAENSALLVAYFGGFLLFLKFVAPFLD
tara:strand:- start:28 stop:216 length:189 start_codon:yes stop_codon:yes gene_type:complete